MALTRGLCPLVLIAVRGAGADNSERADVPATAKHIAAPLRATQQQPAGPVTSGTHSVLSVCRRAGLLAQALDEPETTGSRGSEEGADDWLTVVASASRSVEPGSCEGR